MVAAGEREQVVPAGGGAGELDRGLDGVRAGGAAEVHPPAVRAAGHGVQQRGGEVVLLHRGHVEHVQWRARVEHPPDRRHHHRVVVPERQGARAGQAVHIGPSVRALDHQAARPHRHDRQRPGVGAGRGLTILLPPQHIGADAVVGPGAGQLGGDGHGTSTGWGGPENPAQKKSGPWIRVWTPEIAVCLHEFRAGQATRSDSSGGSVG